MSRGCRLLVNSPGNISWQSNERSSYRDRELQLQTDFKSDRKFVRVCVQEEKKKKLVYSQSPLGIITIIFVIDVVSQEVNRKWEEFSAVPSWWSSDQCLLEPFPTEDWQTERGKVRLLHCTTTTYITDNLAINHLYKERHLDRQSKGRESVLEYNSSLLLILKVLFIISFSNNYILTINLISDIWEHGEITKKEVWQVKKHEQADKTDTQILPWWVFLLRYYYNW